MSNGFNERFTKTEGILNSCQINVIIPALIKQLGKIANNQERNVSFDAEYDLLLEYFNTHFKTQLNLQQLHNFLASKTYFEQQFILDAILRRYMSSHLARDQESRGNVEYDDKITNLTSYEAYQQNDDSLYPGRYPMMPYSDAINYLFKPLGFNLKINDFKKESQTYVEEDLGSIQQSLNPISNIEIYCKDAHFNLAQVVEEDVLLDNNVYKKAHQLLSNAVTASGAESDGHGRFDEPNFGLITNHVEQILEMLKDDTTKDLTFFLSNEAPIDLTIHGYTDEQITELNRIFSSCMNLVSQTLALQLVVGDPISEDHYVGKDKNEVEALDLRLSAQLQAEEIEEFRVSFGI